MTSEGETQGLGSAGATADDALSVERSQPLPVHVTGGRRTRRDRLLSAHYQRSLPVTEGVLPAWWWAFGMQLVMINYDLEAVRQTLRHGYFQLAWDRQWRFVHVPWWAKWLPSKVQEWVGTSYLRGSVLIFVVEPHTYTLRGGEQP